MSNIHMSPIESMPAELKQTILLSMPDLASLAALVHASPCYHAAYASKREIILSAVIVRELQQRGLCFFKPGILLEVWITKSKHPLTSEHGPADWLSVLEYCYEQALTSATTPKLSTEQSILLLGIKAAALWLEINTTDRYFAPGSVVREIVGYRKAMEMDPSMLKLDCARAIFSLGRPHWLTDIVMPEDERKMSMRWYGLGRD